MSNRPAPAYKGRSGEFRSAMRRSAEARRCQKCGRGAAMVTVTEAFTGTYTVCRFCGHHTEPVGGEL